MLQSTKLQTTEESAKRTMALSDAHSIGRSPMESPRPRSRSIWSESNGAQSLRYNIISSPPWVNLAMQLQQSDPQRFAYRETKWSKFDDSQMDNIIIGGFTPRNVMRGSNVLFLASFHNNDAILSQFQVLVALCESFIKSITVLLPYYPTGTMERVVTEGQVATANTIARMFSTLPSIGQPIRVIIFDIHTLQNRFYFYGHALADLVSGVPLLLTTINAYIGVDLLDPGEAVRAEMRNLECEYDAIAFPDEGAKKRFGTFFPGFDLIICGKVRQGDKRIVTIHDGDPSGKRVLIVDDLIKSGGTIAEAAKAITGAGATAVSAFCTHAAGRVKDLLRFLPGGDHCGVFDCFYLTNSVPDTIAQLPANDVFRIIDILPQVITCL